MYNNLIPIDHFVVLPEETVVVFSKETVLVFLNKARRWLPLIEPPVALWDTFVEYWFWFAI